MSRVRVYLLGLFGAAAAAWGFFAIYHQLAHVSFRRKAKNGIPLKGDVFSTKYQKTSPNQSVQLDLSPCVKGESENRVSVDELKHLIFLLPASNTKTSFEIMRTFVQFSNYNENIPSFRSAAVLDDLCSLLHLGGDDEFLRSVNVHVLNLFSNLIVDGIIREHLKAYVGCFFDAKLSSLCTAELVALLRLLGNFSMMDDACISVGKYFSEVFEYVASESNMVRRQAWTVLLNLSCNKHCVDVILETEAFDGFETGLKKIFSEKNEVILLKSIKFLCNVYQGMRIRNRKQFSRESILNALLSAKANLILQATLFLTQAGSTSEELADAQRLLLMLEDC
ncbi:hypothetical protein TSMEX_009900 [Taenia solium]|eukprot:TsM_000667000 transcript=TsM_000667000 gene=TsM_000667000